VSTVVLTEDHVESLTNFNKRFAKQTEDNAIKATWYISVFHATNGEAELPYDVNYGSVYITKYDPYPKKLVRKDWIKDKEEYYETDDYSAQRGVDIEATNKLIAAIIKHARSLGHAIEKKYDDDEFVIKITLHKHDENSYNDVVVTYRASRKTVCEKIVTVVHHEEVIQVIEAHDEEVVTWDCGKVSFMAMNDSDTEDKTKQ